MTSLFGSIQIRFIRSSLSKKQVEITKETTYLPIARRLPTGSVLCVSGTQRQQRIITQVTRFFRSHGRQVITLPFEKIIRKTTKPRLPAAETLRLALQ